MLPIRNDFNAAPKLSIALPNRNQIQGLQIQEAYLRRIAREYGIQVLVSDNKSDDGSAEYLQGQWSDFAEISLLLEDTGFAGNLRNLAGQASGEWIWFIGSGDLPMQSDLLPLLKLLSQTSGHVNTFLDEGVYECLSPYLGGVIYRRAKLLEVVGIELDRIWPHVSWSLAIEQSNPEAMASKTQLIHIEPWTSADDWHSVRTTFPFALALNALVKDAYSKCPSSQRLASDLRQSQKTLLTWYLQDRMAGKIRGLNRSLLQALLLSGSVTQFKFLKILAISVSLVPLKVLKTLNRIRVISS